MFSVRVLYDADMKRVYRGEATLRDYGIDIKLSS
jgi:hypothetical protein